MLHIVLCTGHFYFWARYGSVVGMWHVQDTARLHFDRCSINGFIYWKYMLACAARNADIYVMNAPIMHWNILERIFVSPCLKWKYRSIINKGMITFDQSPCTVKLKKSTSREDSEKNGCIFSANFFVIMYSTSR